MWWRGGCCVGKVPLLKVEVKENTEEHEDVNKCQSVSLSLLQSWQGLG